MIEGIRGLRRLVRHRREPPTPPAKAFPAADPGIWQENHPRFDFEIRRREWFIASGNRLVVLRDCERLLSQAIRTTSDLGTAVRGLIVA